MYRSPLTLLLMALFLYLYPVSFGASYAQRKSPLNDLFLPGHKVHTLPHPKQNTWVILSKDSFEQNLIYYLALCHVQQNQKQRWELTSPSLFTALAWLEALHQTPPQETANFMLNLHHIQTGVNVNLTIGELKATSAPPFRSIITLYTPHERKGGK